MFINTKLIIIVMKVCYIIFIEHNKLLVKHMSINKNRLSKPIDSANNTKLPSIVRSRSLILDQPSPKKQWNQRFTLQQMPEYQPIKNKHTESYQKILTKSTIQINDMQPKRRKKDNINYNLKKQQYVTKKNALIELVKQKLHESDKQLINTIKSMKQCNIPDYFQYYTLKSFCNKPDLKNSLAKLGKDVKSKEDFYYKIHQSFQARKSCLSQIKHFFSKINSEELLSNIIQIENGIKNLRVRTISLIDNIRKWRQNLQLGDEKPIFFTDIQCKTNCLVQLLNDSNFILSSSLAQKIKVGTKNDPLLLSPIKKHNENKDNIYLQIFQLNKPYEYYFHYMQYLASEKAYHLCMQQQIQQPSSINIKQISQINKIYKNKRNQNREGGSNKVNSSGNLLNNQYVQYDQSNQHKISSQKYKEMEIKKQRLQRLYKNQDRINSIRNVYQRDPKKKKHINSEINELSRLKIDQQLMKIQNYSPQNPHKKSYPKYIYPQSQQQSQFDKLVHKKYKNNKHIFKPLLIQQAYHSTPNKVVDKESTKQQLMIENVRQIQNKLKQKIRQISTQEIDAKQYQKYSNKSQSQIVNSLKTDIIGKIEIENLIKSQDRQKRKQQQLKAMQQIKQKMKKEMGQKLEQKKKQKLIQRQQLQKKLRQEEQRFQNQREMERQFQIKLAKQREMRHIQKLKRQSLERQQKLKEQLAIQRQLRKDKDQIIQRERQQKQQIMKKLKREEIQGQVQNKIRQHIFINKEGHQIKIPHKHNKEMEYQNDMPSRGIVQQQQIIHESRQYSEAPDRQKNQSILQFGQSSRNKLLQSQQQFKQQAIPKKVDNPEQALKKQKYQKQQKQQQLRLQIEMMKHKQQRQLQVFQKQIELRERMLKMKLTEQGLNEREVENLVRAAILEERRGQKSDALEYLPQVRKKVQQKMKEQQIQEEQHKKIVEQVKKNKQIEEDQYRRKIRQKIEKQLRIQAISKTKQQIEIRQSKQLVQKKEIHQNFMRRQEALPLYSRVAEKSAGQQTRDRELEKKILLKQQNQQGAKSSLRARFQLQLLSSFQPSSYLHPDNNNSYLLKNTDKYLDDTYLHDKLEANKQSNEPQQFKHAPLNKSKVLQHKYDLTDEQLHVYTKQKKVIHQKQKQTEKDDKNGLAKQIPRKKQVQEGFELVDVSKQPKIIQGEEKKFVVKVVADGRPKKQRTIEKPTKKKPTDGKNKQIQQPNDSEDELKHKKKNKNQKQKKVIKNKVSSQSELSIVQKPQQKAQVTVVKPIINKSKQNPIKLQQQQRQFAQPQQQSQQQSQQEPIKIGRQQQQQQQQPQTNKVVHYDAQKKKDRNRRINDLANIQIKKLKPKVQSNDKFVLEVQAIPEDDLDKYMENHFLRLPTLQTHILVHNRHQLYRKLTSQLTFSLLMGHYQHKLIGMAYVFHDRSKVQVRKLNIAHISTYDNAHLKQFILTVCDYLFRKDPCDQIEFVYQFDQTQAEQALFSQEFNKWFDKYGHIYQKKLDENIFERKYVYKRQFNQQCQVILRGINKNSFNNIFSLYSAVLMSDAGLSQVKNQLSTDSLAEDWISYGVMIAELFRTYMSPDDAEILKNNVKQIPKLKQLLILVVMMQKKKMKLENLKLSSFKTLVELNMKLMSQGKQVIRYAKDSGVQYNELFYSQLNLELNLPFGFQTTSLPTEVKQNETRQINYFRLNPLPSFKLHTVKSSLYNSQMHVLPTQNSKSKLFLINAQQYLQLRKSAKIDLFMYVRYFMKNVRSYTTAAWKYIWIPQMIDKNSWNIGEFKAYLKKDLYVHDHVSLSYRQFLPPALIIEPQHRDLVITPPFILGIMNMGLEQISEGSPIYARMIDADCLRTLQIQQNN